MFPGVDLGAEGGLKLAESLRALTTLHSLKLRLDSTTFFLASQTGGIVRPWVREVFV